MAILDELSASLRTVADRQGSRPPRVHTVQPRRTGAFVIATLLLAVAGAGAAGLWSPQLGDKHRGEPTTARSRPPQAQMNILGILRDGATADDHGGSVTRALKMLDPSVTGVRVDYVRALPNDGVLIPVERYQPAGQQEAINDALCLYLPDPVGGGGVGCYSAEQVEEGRALLAVGSKPTTAGGSAATTGSSGHFTRGPVADSSAVHVLGLVPDGVATVTVGSSAFAVDANAFSGGEAAPAPLSARWAR